MFHLFVFVVCGECGDGGGMGEGEGEGEGGEECGAFGKGS